MAKKKRKNRSQQHRRNRESCLSRFNLHKPTPFIDSVEAEILEQDYEAKKVSKGAVLAEKIRVARETEKRIVPPGMTYGEYMDYLKEKRQQLEDKKAGL